jgi:hypothetical protein
MLIAAVLCLCAAVVTAGVGTWSLRRPHSTDTVPRVLRSVAPIQLATAVMLAAGGAVALVAPRSTGVTVLMVCVIGAVGTFAAGCYQGAKAGAAMMGLDDAPASDGCAGSCANCTLSCS